LWDLIPHTEKNERHDDNANDRPEVEKLSRQNRSVAICQNSEIVSLYVHERENEVFPPVYEEDPPILLEAVPVYSIS
jgi:hypothetical protein